MTRLLSGMSLILILAISGCSSESNTNVLENADQAKIDAYNKQAEEDAKALGGYDGPK
ncbi:hypothetical protein [Rubripirellula reticaptiva]|uniref:Secreted protein n=1 Tax=Rubripirellula reticaptiva TaxID=2528013 RepID=A0A5C6ERV5_9BACT|nr:hypothetical protein [Rubripirellula reticaptiva]TWU51732.1 hypothetical protein Poly59_33270 [Rubripirellula reticaptiva]